MEPPQVEPAMATWTGWGQNSDGRREGFAAAQKHGGIAVVQRLNLETVEGEGRRVDAAFDLRLDDAAVHFVGQVGWGLNILVTEHKGIGFSGVGTRVL